MKKYGMAASLAVVLSLVLSGTLVWAGQKVSGAEARSLVEGGATLLDVRTDREVARGYIDGALHIPVQVLDERIDELGNKEDEIVIYCRTGRRSANAARMLRAAGYEKVYDMGAMSNWE